MKDMLPWTPAGVNLEDFIKNNEKLLRKSRIFYVIQANSDKNRVTKIGIAGTISGQAVARLYEYVHFHGYNNDRNPAQGVKIIACYYTAYDKNVPSKNTVIYKLEQQIKNEIKFKENALKLKRGTERTTFNLRNLYQRLKDRKLIKEDEFDKRKSPRVEKQEKINKELKKIT